MGVSSLGSLQPWCMQTSHFQPRRSVWRGHWPPLLDVAVQGKATRVRKGRGDVVPLSIPIWLRYRALLKNQRVACLDKRSWEPILGFWINWWTLSRWLRNHAAAFLSIERLSKLYTQLWPYLGAGLVDGADDRFTPLGQRLQYGHHVLGHERVQSGCGLITEHQRRIGDDLRTRHPSETRSKHKHSHRH